MPNMENTARNSAATAFDTELVIGLSLIAMGGNLRGN